MSTGGSQKQEMILVVHIFDVLTLIFELTSPLWVIHRYGYPDVHNSSDETITNDEDSVSANHRLSKIDSKRNSVIIRPNIRSQLGLEEIMEDNHFHELFGEYMGREFQMEIFLFFEVMHYYKEAVSDPYNTEKFAKDDAKLIIDEFIADDAVNKLPLPDRIRRRVIEDFNKLDDNNEPGDVPSIFQPAIDDLKVQLSFHIYKFSMNI